MKFMKKKLFLFGCCFVILSTFLHLVSVNAEENSCEIYTNYYLFLSSTSKGGYFIPEFEKNEGKSISVETSTVDYDLKLPVGAKKIDEGLVDFTDTSDNIDEMSLEDFYDYWLESNEGIYSIGNVNYVRGSGWIENGEFKDNSEELYTDFIERVPENYGNPEIIMNGSGNKVQLSITRTWEKEEIDALEKDLVYSPAVYYVQYEVCNDYDITVHYMDDSNDKELFNTVIEEELADGDKYDAYTCPSTLKDYDSYSLNKNKKYQHDGGTIEGKNVDLYCYYDKKVTLTINFGTNNDCSEGNNIKKSVTTEQIVGQNVKHTIPTEFSDSENDYEFSNVGLVSPTFNTKVNTNILSFEMPNKNASVCLVYIKNPKTGISWIYFAWIIGIGALAYSVWYFMKYRNINNEI